MAQPMNGVAIDRRLNLVTSVITEVGQVYVHSTPISSAIFRQYHMIIGKTFASIWSEAGIISGPRMAAMILEDIAREMNVWDDVQAGLMGEMHRLTNVIFPKPDGGWQVLPLELATKHAGLTEDDIAEVDGLLVFFTVNSVMQRRTAVASVLDRMGLWGAQTSFLNATAFLNSLPILTETGTSPEAAAQREPGQMEVSNPGGKPVVSSVPS